MDHFKSDFIKVLMLIIVLLSFTSGPQKTRSELIKDCEDEMRISFGLDKPLLQCVADAILKLSINERHPCENVNEYHLRMYKLVTAEGIDLKKQFCEKVDDEKNKLKRLLFAEADLNYVECMKKLKPFDLEDPIEKKEMKSILPYLQLTREEYDLKEKILYNALYYQKRRFSNIERKPYRHIVGTYGAVYLQSIADSVLLIDVADIGFTPRKFCSEIQEPRENDLETSTSSYE